MSHSTNRSFKVHYRAYLKHPDEPMEDLHDEAAVELDIGMIRNSYYEKMRLRRTAERLRRYV
jgi:hypothetical protein